MNVIEKLYEQIPIKKRAGGELVLADYLTIEEAEAFKYDPEDKGYKTRRGVYQPSLSEVINRLLDQEHYAAYDVPFYPKGLSVEWVGDSPKIAIYVYEVQNESI